MISGTPSARCGRWWRRYRPRRRGRRDGALLDGLGAAKPILRADDERPLRRDEERLAVRLGAEDILGAEVLRRAGAVLDHHGLAELGGEMLAEDARHQIAVRAGRQRHDDADRAGGVDLRGGGGGEKKRREHDGWQGATDE